MLSKDLSGGLEGSLGLATSLDALQDGLTVLVDVKLGDDDLGWVDAEWDGLARGLLLDNALNVHDVLETVYGGDLSLTALVGTTDNGDLVVLADWHRADLIIVRSSSGNNLLSDAYVVLLTELLGERSAHDSATNAGWSLEVRLARLAAGAVEGCNVVSFRPINT